jgi:hypothetical protein
MAMGHHQKHRFRVEIVIVALRHSGPTHTFASREKAERFAHAISHYLPTAPRGEFSVAWALVYALPMSGTRDLDRGHCYLSIDPGGIEVKRHSILAGCYGHGKRPPARVPEIDDSRPLRVTVRDNFGGARCEFATLAEIAWHPILGRVTFDRDRETPHGSTRTITRYYMRYHRGSILNHPDACDGADCLTSFSMGAARFARIASEVNAGVRHAA